MIVNTGFCKILAGIVLGYGLTHLIWWTPPSPSALLVLYLGLGLGAVGVADDYLKIFRRRATGLRARTKLIGQAVVALTFAIIGGGECREIDICLVALSHSLDPLESQDF